MTGLGEVPPTAGLEPRWRDVLPLRREGSLETAICTQLRLPDIAITGTGTAALLTAFTHLAHRRPDRRTVIVSGYTCPLVVIAAHAAGLRCIACDTTEGGFDLDLQHLRQLIDRDTLAVVPTHYGGVLTDVARISAITPPEVAVVEDAAQAFGATWAGASVGLAGDIGVFSFGVGKGFTLYEGGALVARDPAVMGELRRVYAGLTRPSALSELVRCISLLGYHALYNPMGLRLAYGLPKRRWLARDNEIEAAGDTFDASISVHPVGAWRTRVGRAALARLPTHLLQCRARFDRLADRLEAIPGVRPHRPVRDAHPSATFLFASLPDSPRARAALRRLWLSRHGVAKMFSRAIGDYPDMRPLLRPSETPNARALAATTMTVTTHRALSTADEAAIVATLLGGAA